MLEQAENQRIELNHVNEARLEDHKKNTEKLVGFAVRNEYLLLQNRRTASETERIDNWLRNCNDQYDHHSGERKRSLSLSQNSERTKTFQRMQQLSNCPIHFVILSLILELYTTMPLKWY